jgi:hypothetical protein
MSIGDVNRGPAALRAPAGHVPLWSIGLTALLVATGFARRPFTSPASTRTAGGTPVEEDGRGRSATTPSEIPARGWKDIVLRVYEGISDDRILANAAAVTFYALLALFPAIAALVSIYGLFADPSTMASRLDSVSGILPGGAIVRGKGKAKFYKSEFRQFGVHDRDDPFPVSGARLCNRRSGRPQLSAGGDWSHL